MVVGRSDAKYKGTWGRVLDLEKGLGLSRAAGEMRDLNHSSPTVPLETESPRWPYWCYDLGRMREALCTTPHQFDGRTCPTAGALMTSTGVKVNLSTDGAGSTK